MKRKKIVLEKYENVYNSALIKINKEENGIYFFEIGKELTTDIGEAVCILMRNKEFINDPIWNLDIHNIDNISPDKSLYWLTGGDREWRILDNYSKPWCECYLDFQEEFGFMVVNIIKRSSNFKEVRDNFIKYLNLPILYDFAIRKNLIKSH